MGLHVIIGKGNLGCDLQIALDKAGHDARLLTPSEGFEWPEDEPHIHSLAPECIWIAAGFGSIDQCKNDPMGAIQTHTIMPMEIADAMPETRLVVFSTDYVANESDPNAPSKSVLRPKSLYACSKLWMEQGLYMLNRPLTTIVRVGSLYGSHFPEKTFPGKLVKNHPKPCQVHLPQNWVVPTPTWWIAERLASQYHRLFNEKGPITHHVAPAGGCTILQWGRKVLGEDYNIASRGFDDLRPAYSKLGYSLGGHVETWDQLWEWHVSSRGAFSAVVGPREG